MPRMDGTGPLDKGPRSGWGRGRCKPRDPDTEPIAGEEAARESGAAGPRRLRRRRRGGGGGGGRGGQSA